MRNLSLVALALAFGLMLMANVGCMKCGENIAERALEKAVEAGSGGKAKIDIGGNVDLSDLPAFLRYPGAKGQSKWSMSGEEGTGTVYALESGDPLKKVVDWYKSSLSGAGWKQGSQMETTDSTMLLYGSPDEKQMATVTIASEDKQTTIVVMYGTK